MLITYVPVMTSISKTLYCRFNAVDCGYEVNMQSLQQLAGECTDPGVCGDADAEEYFDYVMQMRNLPKPQDVDSALRVYFILKEIARL